MIGGLGLAESVYIVADAHHANGQIIKGLLGQGHYLVSHHRRNALANERAPAVCGKRTR